MAQALVEWCDRSGGTLLKVPYALRHAPLKDGLRPIDSCSSFEGVRIASAARPESAEWNIEDSRSLYAVDGWGQPYFTVQEAGRLCVKAAGMNHAAPSHRAPMTICSPEPVFPVVKC